MPILLGLWRIFVYHYKAAAGFLLVVVFIAFVGNEPAIWLANQLRGLFGLEQDTPIATTAGTALPASPRAELASKGYAIDQTGLRSATATGQFDDAELFTRVGVKFSSIPAFNFHLAPDIWTRLNDWGVVADAACTNIDISTQDSGFLDLILEYGNTHILETTCAGAYLSRLAEAHAAHLVEKSALQEEDEREQAAYDAFLPQCRSDLNALFSADNVKEIYLCSARFEGRCDDAKNTAIKAQVEAMNDKADSMGLHGRINWFGSFRGQSLIPVDLADSYSWNIVQVGGSQGHADFAAGMDAMASELCQRFEPLAAPVNSYAHHVDVIAERDAFYDRFAELVGTR